jgi:uncharacterized small protein (DUF1192 family)
MLPSMDDDDLPTKRGPDLGAASLLARESLDSYSLDELDARTELLRAEIDRIKAHRDKTATHMQSAEALFRPKPS